MGCVVKTSKEFKDLAARNNVANNTLELFTHKYWLETGNETLFPTDVYIQAQLGNSHYLEKGPNVRKLWRMMYSSPKEFTSMSSLQRAYNKATKYFPKSAIVYYKNAKGNFVLSVKRPVEKADYTKDDFFDEFDNVGSMKDVKKLDLDIKEKQVYGIDKVQKLYNRFNTDKTSQALADRAFNIAKELGLQITFDESLPFGTMGRYTNDNTIRFKKSFLERDMMNSKKAPIMLHEVLHALSMYALSNQTKNWKRSENLEGFRTEMNSLYQDLKSNPILKGERGIVDLHEFVAELANPVFRSKLQQIDKEAKAKKSFWSRILDAFKNLLGLHVTNSYYQRSMNALDKALDAFDIDTYMRYNGIKKPLRDGYNAKEWEFNSMSDAEVKSNVKDYLDKQAAKKRGARLTNIRPEYKGKLIYAQSGTGKSTIADNVTVFDSDYLLGQILGVSPETAGFFFGRLSADQKKAFGEQYRQAIRDKIAQGYTVVTANESLLPEADVVVYNSSAEQTDDRVNREDRAINNRYHAINYHESTLSKIKELKEHDKENKKEYRELDNEHYLSDIISSDPSIFRNTSSNLYDNSKQKESNSRLREEVIADFLNEFGITVHTISNYDGELPLFDALNRVINAKEPSDITDGVGYAIAFMMQGDPEMQRMVVESHLGMKGDFNKRVPVINKTLKNLHPNQHSPIAKEVIKEVGRQIATELRDNFDSDINDIKFDNSVWKIIKNFFKKLGMSIAAWGHRGSVKKNEKLFVKDIIAALGREDYSRIKGARVKEDSNELAQRVDVETALKENPYEDNIIRKLGEHGIALAGSTSIALQGSLFRPSENPLHDIDFNAGNNSSKESLDKLLPQIFPEGTIQFSHALKKNKNGDQTVTYITLSEPFEIRKTGFDTADLYSKDGRLLGKRKHYDLELVDGVQGKMLDFFTGPTQESNHGFYNQTINGHNYLLSESNAAMAAKILWARPKDMWDYKNFKKNDFHKTSAEFIRSMSAKELRDELSLIKQESADYGIVNGIEEEHKHSGKAIPQDFTFADGTKVRAPFKPNAQQVDALNAMDRFMKSDETSMTLSGYAGTGKTSLMELIAKKGEMQHRPVIFCASTNKAAAVLNDRVRKSGFEAATLNKIFGIQVEVNPNSKSYNAKNLVNKVKDPREIDITPETTVIIDEASMINEENYNILNRIAEQKGLKIIYVGDEAQLAPVNEDKISKVFKNGEGKVIRLTQVERTDDNAILKEATDIRNGKPLSRESSFNSKGEGVAYISPEHQDAIDEVIEHYVKGLKQDPNYFRILAYTNKAVAAYNDYVRELLGYNTLIPQSGEPMTGYNNWGYDWRTKSYRFINSEAYKVIKTDAPITVSTRLENGTRISMQAIPVTLEDSLGKMDTFNYMDIKSNLQNRQAAMILANEKKRFFAKARQVMGKQAKAEIYAKINDLDKFLFVNDNIEDGRGNTLQAKTIDFGYAMTVHKSQGSTFTHVLMDDADITRGTRSNNMDNTMPTVELGEENNNRPSMDNLKSASEEIDLGDLSNVEVASKQTTNLKQQLEYVGVSRATDTVTVISNNVKKEGSPLHPEKAIKEDKSAPQQANQNTIPEQLISHLKSQGINVKDRTAMEEFLKTHKLEYLQQATAYGKEHPYKNSRHRRKVPEILSIVKAKKYNKPGTDAVTLDSEGHRRIYLIDHSADKELADNLKDGDGFGIRKVYNLNKLSEENVKEIIRNISPTYEYSTARVLHALQTIGLGQKDLFGIDVAAELQRIIDSNDEIYGKDRSLWPQRGFRHDHSDSRDRSEDERSLGQKGLRQLYMTPQGEVYGFVDKEGNIYLDETKISPEHPIHEYTHLWDRTVQQKNPKLWQRGVELMKQTSLWNEILNDANYGKVWQSMNLPQEKLDNLIASEVHARFTGEGGEKLLNQIAEKQGQSGIIAKLKQWILDVWKDLKATFGNWSQEDLDKLTLKDFNHMPVRDLAEGVDIRKLADINSTEGTQNDSERFNNNKQSQTVISSNKTILSNDELKYWNSKGVGEEPRILVASEHSDPAFHVTEILKVLEGKRSVPTWQKKSFTGKDFAGLYLITKQDGLPLRKLLETKIPKLIHFSITGLGGTEYEPGVMKYNDLLDRIQDYIKQGLDPECVTIRIDPIVPGVTKESDIEAIVKRASEMGIKRIRFSVMDAYPKTIEAMEEKGLNYDFETYYGINNNPKYKVKYNFNAKKAHLDKIADFMLSLKDKYDITLGTCAEPLVREGIKKDGCLSVAAVNNMLGTSIVDKGTANNGSRKLCSCYGGKSDALAYASSCASHCIYCYAKHSNDTTLKYYNEDGSLKDNVYTRTQGTVKDLIRDKRQAKTTQQKQKVDWARTSSNGYEVSTRGDKRFSALVATFKPGTIIDGVDVGGKTIEYVYQNVIKKSGKGKAPAKDSKLYNESLKTNEEREDFSYQKGYLPLWKEWAKQNPELMAELREKSQGKVLTDQFANTRVSQARALAEILNESEVKDNTQDNTKVENLSEKKEETQQVSLPNYEYFNDLYDETPVDAEWKIPYLKELDAQITTENSPEENQNIINQMDKVLQATSETEYKQELNDTQEKRVEETLDEYDKLIQQINNLLEGNKEFEEMDIANLSASEVRHTAELIANQISDLITELQKEEGLAQKQYPDLKTKLDFTTASRKQIVETVGINRLIERAKALFDSDNAEYDDIETNLQADLITENWDAMMYLAADVFALNEGFGISKDFTSGRFITTEKSTIDYDNFNDYSNDQDAAAEEGEKDEQEHWQVESRTIDVLNSMSALVRQGLHECYVLDKNGNKVLSKWGIPERVNPRDATNSILRWTQGVLSLEQMVSKLSEKQSQAPWLSQLIERLSDKTGKETDFQSQFYSVFSKHFQLYSIVLLEDGKYHSIPVNSHPALSEAMASINSLFKIGEHPLFTEKRINTKLLGTKDTIGKNYNFNLHKALLEIRQVEAALNKGETLNDDMAKTITDNVVAVCKVFGYNITEDMLSDAINQENISKMAEALRYIVNSLDRAKEKLHKRELQSYDPFKFGAEYNINNSLRNFLTPITDKLEDIAVNAFYDSGKMYQSYVTPSFMTKLMNKFHQTGQEFEDFIMDEYGSSEWFKQGSTLLEEGWRNEWLKWLATDETMRKMFDHKVELNFNKHNYMRNMNDAEYTLSLITEYFAENADRYSDMAPSWYRVPMQSNKPSSEFIKFYSYRGDKYKSNIVNGMHNIFLQEVSRIQTVRMRNLSEDDAAFIKNFDSNGRKFNFLPALNGYLENTETAKAKRKYLESTEENNRFAELLQKKVEGAEKLIAEEETELANLADKAIRQSIEDRVQSILDKWERDGILEAAKNIKGIYPSDFDSAQNTAMTQEEKENAKNEWVRAQVENFLWNDTFASKNILQLTLSDIAFYKDTEDLQKRLAQLHAPGNRGNINALDYTGKRVSDGKYRTFILKDFDSFKSNIIANIAEVFDRKIAAAPENQKAQLRALKESLVGKRGKYTKINVTDAQGYSSPSSYRKKAFIFGRWSREAEGIYQKLLKGDYNYSDLETAFQPLKPFVYSKLTKDMGVPNAPITSMQVPFQAKNAEYLLIMADAILKGESLSRPNLLRAVYRVMEDSERLMPTKGIDTVQFESAIKSGLQGTMNIHQFREMEGGEEAAYTYMMNQIFKEEIDPNTGDRIYQNYNTNTFVHETSYEDYCLQQEVPEHFKEHSQAHGSQTRMIIPSDLDFYTTDENGAQVDNYYEWTEPDGTKRKVKADEYRKEYEETIAANIEDSIQTLETELCLKSDSRKERNIALSKILQREILSSPRYGVDLIQACTIDKETGEFRIPKGDPIQAKRIEQLINSVIKNRINKQKIAGGPIVQVSNFGTSQQLHIRFNDKQGNLIPLKEDYIASEHNNLSYEEYCKKHQGGIAYFEVFAPIWSNELYEKFSNADGTIDVETIEALDPELLKMVSYRIPTEDKYSCAPMKIVGFMPREAGDAIMLPYELTEIDDSDFDVDKRYVMRKDIPIKERNYHDYDDALIAKGKELYQSLMGVEPQKGYIERQVGSLVHNPQKYDRSSDFRKALYKEYQKMAFYTDAPTSGRTYRDNKIIDMTYAVLTNEMSADKILNPGGFDGPKKMGYMVAAYKNPANNLSWNEFQGKSIDELKDLSYTDKDLTFADTQVQFYKQNAAASSLIGVFAVNKVAHATLESNSIWLDVSEICGEKPFAIANTTFGRRMKIDTKYDSEGNLIGKTLGSLVSASADAVKDPILNLMNVNMTTAGILNTMLRLGMPFNDAALFLSQDIIERVLNQFNRENLNNYVSLDSLINKLLEEYRGNNDIAENSTINTESLSKEELIEGLTPNEHEVIDYKVLLAFQKLRALSEAMRKPTFATRFNSISSAVGPLIVDNLIMEHKKEQFLEANTNSTHFYKDVESDDSIDINDIFDQHPILQQFSRTMDIAKDLFLDMPTGSTGFRNLMKVVPKDISDKMYGDKKLLDQFSLFYQSYLLIQSGIINPENLNNYVNGFAKWFTEKKFKEKYVGNELIQAIKMNVSKKSNRPYLSLNLTGMDEQRKEQFRNAWIDLHKKDPMLSKMLFDYSFFRAGIGFSPKTFMSLVPTYVKERLQSKDGNATYVDTYRNFPEVNKNLVIDQFIRNNWDNNKLVPFRGGKDTKYNVDIKHNRLTVYRIEDKTDVADLSYMKTKGKGGIMYLWRKVSEAETTEGDIVFELVKPLGNNGEYLEMSLNDIKTPLSETTTAVKDNTTSDLKVDSAAETNVEETSTTSLTTESEASKKMAELADLMMKQNPKLDKQNVLNKIESMKGKEQVYRKFLQNVFKQKGLELNEEEAINEFKKYC